MNQKEYLKIWRAENAEYIKKYSKNWRKNNPDAYKLWAEKNKDKRKAINKKYNLKEESKIKKKEIAKKRRLNNLHVRISDNLRIRLHHALKRNQRNGSAVRDLGCTIEELKLYIESLWKPGMNWNNWGIKGWHIDHIKPLSSFNLSNREEFLKACYYTNLQPLWSRENLHKSNKIL